MPDIVIDGRIVSLQFGTTFPFKIIGIVSKQSHSIIQIINHFESILDQEIHCR